MGRRTHREPAVDPPLPVIRVQRVALFPCLTGQSTCLSFEQRQELYALSWTLLYSGGDDAAFPPMSIRPLFDGVVYHGFPFAANMGFPSTVLTGVQEDDGRDVLTLAGLVKSYGIAPHLTGVHNSLSSRINELWHLDARHILESGIVARVTRYKNVLFAFACVYAATGRDPAFLDEVGLRRKFDRLRQHGPMGVHVPAGMSLDLAVPAAKACHGCSERKFLCWISAWRRSCLACLALADPTCAYAKTSYQLEKWPGVIVGDRLVDGDTCIEEDPDVDDVVASFADLGQCVRFRGGEMTVRVFETPGPPSP